MRVYGNQFVYFIISNIHRNESIPNSRLLLFCSLSLTHSLSRFDSLYMIIFQDFFVGNDLLNEILLNLYFLTYRMTVSCKRKEVWRRYKDDIIWAIGFVILNRVNDWRWLKLISRLWRTKRIRIFKVKLYLKFCVNLRSSWFTVVATSCITKRTRKLSDLLTE